MKSDEAWQVIAEQRLSLADLLADLSDAECEKQSLCAGWRTRDVAAHIAMTPLTTTAKTLIVEGLRARGDFHRLNHDLAVRHADTRSTAQIVGELREHAHSRKLPALTNYRNVLFDVLVHGQDISIPLGRARNMPVAAARAGAERVWAMGWPFHARRRLRGLRLVASDTDWSAGDGTEVRGTVQALLLLLTGRTAAALSQLDGPGVVRLC